MKMDDTHYLPSEELKMSNYPEVRQLEGDIEEIVKYAKLVDATVLAYNNGTVNKIDLDVVILQKMVDNCREVCRVLGRAPNVCYDILLELRNFQMNFQDLIFMKTRFGSEYIGKPTIEAELDAEGGVG